MPSAPLLRPSALARFWELNPRTLPEWIKAGRLVAIRSPGGHYRVRPSDVRDFCAREGLRVPPFAREDATRVVLAGIAATGERAVEKAVAGKSVGLASFASAMEGIVAAARPLRCSRSTHRRARSPWTRRSARFEACGGSKRWS